MFLSLKKKQKLLKFLFFEQQFLMFSNIFYLWEKRLFDIKKILLLI